MAALLSTLISSQGDGSDAQYSERPRRFAKSVQSQVVRGREVVGAGPCALTEKFWPWNKVSLSRRRQKEDLLMLFNFGVPFIHELPVEEYSDIPEFSRHSLHQCLLIESIIVEYGCTVILNFDHDDDFVLRARV